MIVRKNALFLVPLIGLKLQASYFYNIIKCGDINISKSGIGALTKNIFWQFTHA